MRMIKSALYALNGLKTVWKEEHNFRLEAAVAVLILSLAYFLRFSYFEFFAVTIAVTLVLSAEILNTAIEDLCNKVEPREDAAIGKIKDMMAAFTLIASIGALVIGIVVFLNHFG